MRYTVYKQCYNDLGFRIGGRVILLAESRSDRTMDIYIRTGGSTWNNHMLKPA